MDTGKNPWLLLNSPFFPFYLDLVFFSFNMFLLGTVKSSQILQYTAIW